jgi:hypothetical protein
MPKGFGSLTPERRREISSAGGKAAHAAGTAHRFSSQEAKAAGRIGGLKARKRQLALDALATPPASAEEDGHSTPGGPPWGTATEPPPVTHVDPSTHPVHGRWLEEPGCYEDGTLERVTEPPPPAAPTEPAPAPADPQAALDAAEIQRVYDEAMARL